MNEEVKRHFLKNNLANRLGCIAANLARVESFSRMPNSKKVIEGLLNESKFFIEWAAPGIKKVNTRVTLVDAQIKIALWEYARNKANIAVQAGKLSREILKLSGLA